MLGRAQRWCVVGAVLGISVTLGGCSSSSSESSTKGGSLPSTIHITLLADKTGQAAFYGAQLEAGVQTAVSYVNSSDQLKGSKIEVTVKDTGTDPPTALALTSAAVRDKVAAILGPSVSNEALTAAPAAQQGKVPFLADTDLGENASPGEYVYSMTTPHSSQMPALATYVAAQGVKSVDLIFAGDNVTIAATDKAATSAFADAGMTVKNNIETSVAATDFSAVATKAKKDAPEAVIVLGGGPMMSSIPNALRAAGYQGPLFANMGADGTISAAGAAVNGLVYPAEWVEGLPGSASAQFSTQFHQAYPKLTPYYPAVDGYNEVLFLAKALTQAGSTDGPALVKAMQSIAASGFETISGQAQFSGDGKRQLVDPTVLVKFADNKLELVK